jgi:DNA/RNA-binding domain of Phe-tRNA-synthetase-like protein
MKTMNVRLSNDFLEQFPDASIHTLVADGISKVNDELVKLWQAKAAAAIAAWGIDPQRLVEEPWISEWRDAMKKMGLNAAKTRSSIEQLAKRALGGTFISTPIPTVNLYCAISTIAKAPMGGYRVESLEERLDLRLSHGTERFLGIGEKVPVQVAPGVVVYALQERVACYAWNHKDSALTCLTQATDKAVFFADAVSIAGRARAEFAIETLQQALESCHAEIPFSGVLDRNTPHLDVPLDDRPELGTEWDEVIHGS